MAFRARVAGKPAGHPVPTNDDDDLEVGDKVKMEVGGVPMEGKLRFLGEVEGKEGSWAGVELGGQWIGRGKNDGSVRGTHYFSCPPLCGLFLPLAKVAPARTRPAPSSNSAPPRTPTTKSLLSSTLPPWAAAVPPAAPSKPKPQTTPLSSTKTTPTRPKPRTTNGHSSPPRTLPTSTSMPANLYSIRGTRPTPGSQRDPPTAPPSRAASPEHDKPSSSAEVVLLRAATKTLQLELKRATETQQRSSHRVEELSITLFESQSETESLRKELAQLRQAEAPSSALDEFRRTIQSLTQDASRSSDLVRELREDLRQAEKEIEKGHLVLLTSREAQQAPTQDSPSLSPTSPRKRESLSSWNGSSSQGGGMDGGVDDVMKAQVDGLKIMVQALTDENQELLDKNDVLVRESLDLKDAQTSLETTVENLMNMMSSGAAPNPASVERALSQGRSAAALQREVDTLKERLKDAEAQAAKDIKALKQEVTELEALLESLVA